MMTQREVTLVFCTLPRLNIHCISVAKQSYAKITIHQARAPRISTLSIKLTTEWFGPLFQTM